MAGLTVVPYAPIMRMTTGTVVDGKIEVPGESFSEGQSVTVLAPEGDETFTLPAAEVAALREAMAEGDRGEVISTEEFFQELGFAD